MAVIDGLSWTRGNLTADPELKYTDGGSTLVKFSIAKSNGHFEDGKWVDDEPDYFDFVAWGQLAQNVANTCEKGTRVVVIGAQKQNRWQQEIDGEMKNRSRVEFRADIVAVDLQFVEVGDIRKVKGKEAEGSSSEDDF